MSEVSFVAGYLPFPDRLRVREALSLFAGFYGFSRKAGDAAVARQQAELALAPQEPCAVGCDPQIGA